MVVESELFTFCIGPEQEKFTIHSGAVLGLSSYFRSIINSQARQAEAQRICWVHIDKETFLIFSQFAYTGDYAVPDIVAWPDHWGDASPQTEGLQAALERFAAFSDPKHSVKVWATQVNSCLDKTLLTRQEYIMSPLLEHITTHYRFLSLDNSFSEEDIAPGTLLIHAKAYVLARRYSIHSLEDLALHKLYQTLMTMQLNFHVVDYISNLIRYTYNNTESHDHGANANPLRDLLVSFCACVYDGFLINPSFRAVLRDHGEFAEGIIDKLKVILD